MIRKRDWIELSKNMPEMKFGKPREGEVSEIFEWIKSNDEFLFTAFHRMRQNGYITYDPIKKTWKGINK